MRQGNHLRNHKGKIMQNYQNHALYLVLKDNNEGEFKGEEGITISDLTDARIWLESHPHKVLIHDIGMSIEDFVRVAHELFESGNKSGKKFSKYFVWRGDNAEVLALAYNE